MPRLLRCFPLLAACAFFMTLWPPALRAEDEPLHATIDRLIAEQSDGFAERAAPVAGDEEFLRRVYLDLIGRIPSANEARGFLADDDPEKREKVIDDLLARPEFDRHLMRRLDVLFMRRLAGSRVPADQWREFLRRSLAGGDSYAEIVRAILGNDGTDAENRGPARFYLDRGGETNEITRDVASLFLGADLTCAQCHDHPEIDDYLMADYYGLAAFFVRSSVFKDPKLKADVLAEKAEGEVSYKSVFVKDDPDHSTPPRLFGGEPLAEPAFAKDEAYVVKPDKNVRPIPKFSRLAQLPDRLASAENERFCRTAANRFWAMMFGRGIIHPVDQDHSGNPPSHPRLLKLLAAEFAAHDFDIRRLVREIALSRTYQRASRLPSSVADPLPPAAFGQAMLRPLTPEQFAWSVLEATGETGIHRAAAQPAVSAAAEKEKSPQPLDEQEAARRVEAELVKRLAGYEQRFVALFGGQPGEPPEGFESTVDQVLYLANDPQIVGLLAPKSGNLVERLKKLPAEDDAAAAEELFLSILTRRPTEEEMAAVTKYLAAGPPEERTDALSQIAWALICSAEFRFNH